jgi:hypothetical protein
MVPLTLLWLPILLSAVIVFVVSSVIHMILPFHRNDFRKIPEEDKVMEALRPFHIPPGDYAMPCAGNPKEMQAPGFVDKMTKGPVGFLTVIPSGPPRMGKSLVRWFVYCIMVGIFAAYIASRALEPGDRYLSVFRFVGCTAFIGYSVGLWQNTIWYGRSWRTTLKSTIDGLVYALLTAGTFGWLWPS